MKRSLPVLFVSWILCLPLVACDGAGSATPADAAAGGGAGEGAEAPAEADAFAGREVVDNWLAQSGEVTVCPISGKKFEVDDKSGHFSYQGYTFVFCCDGKCLEQVEADPGKFLDALVEEAGGPASDPEPDVGGAIDEA